MHTQNGSSTSTNQAYLHRASARVTHVQGISPAELIQVHPAIQAYWVLAEPSPRLGVVPSAAELDEARVGVVEPALKPERLEAGVGVDQHPPEGVVVEPLRDRAGRRVHDEAHRALVVGDDAVGGSAAPRRHAQTNRPSADASVSRSQPWHNYTLHFPHRAPFRFNLPTKTNIRARNRLRRLFALRVYQNTGTNTIDGKSSRIPANQLSGVVKNTTIEPDSETNENRKNNVSNKMTTTNTTRGIFARYRSAHSPKART